MTAVLHPAAAVLKTTPLWPRLVLAAVLTAAFAFPNLAALWYGADPLTIANESVGYRYLFSERLLNGEGASVWVLAGFLTTAIQTTWLAVINLFSEPTPAELAWRLHVFSHGFSGMVVVAAGTVLFSAALNRRLSFTELALLAIPALGPAFATRSSGFYYYTLPDYYHLNVLLTLASTWLFLIQIRNEQPVTHPLCRLFLLGLFVGMICANKITMLMIGLPLIIVPLLDAPLSWPRLMLRSLLCGAGTVAGFLFVIAWFYLFNPQATIGMFAMWLNTVRNPGGESNFWTSNFRGFLTGYSYGYIIAFFGLSVIIAAILAFRDRLLRRQTLPVVGVLLLGGLAWAYFIYKRPAGTTFFEAVVALFGFSAIALAFGADRRWGRWLISGLLLFWVGYSATTFEWRRNLGILQESGPWARRMWQLHQELLEFASGHDIVVIHPQNHYGYGGVAEFLLKGTADVPTWNLSEHGRPILERYAPRMTFRHEYGGTQPNSPFPDNAVVFWVDRPEFPPMIEQYSLLKEAFLRPDNEKREWVMKVQGDRATIKAYALKLASSAVSQKQQVLASPPSGFSGERIKPDTIKLTWHEDGIARIVFEFRAGQGDWATLGHANETMNSYYIGDISPIAEYAIRARKEFAGSHSDWVEIKVPLMAGAKH